MAKLAQLKIYETFLRKHPSFSNITVNGDWINFSCILAPYAAEHRFKNDRTPSSGITIGSDGITYYKCFTCKHQGPFIRTLERYEVKAKKDLTNLKNLVSESQELPDYEYLTLAEDRVKPEPLPFTSIFEPLDNYPEAQKYLLSRNISLTTAKRLCLEFDPEGRRIVFPVKDRKGILYGFTGRSIDPDEKQKIKDYHFQKSQFLLGVEYWKDQPTVIVEGLFAYAHLHEISKGKYFPYNITAIMGSSASKEQIETLIEFGKPIYLLLDGDKAGQAGIFGKNGIVHHTKDQIPTFTLPWPRYKINVLGAEIIVRKTDPDNLTYDELYSMLQKPRLVV